MTISTAALSAPLHNGWTVTQLNAAFKAIQAKTHWKDPISAWVPFHLVKVTLDAIEFYTGTVGQITAANSGLKKVLVVATGYRAGPCGDH